MSNKKKYFFLFIVFLSFQNFSLADDKVYYLDLDYIINNSVFGKKLILNLETLKKNELEKLKSEEDELIKFEKDLLNKKNIISEEEFKKNLNILKKNVAIFNKKKIKVSKEFETKKNKDIAIFFEQSAPHIKNYMSENSINILIDKKNVFIGKSNYDITDDILKVLDKNL